MTIRKIEIDKDYTHVGLFVGMKKGDIFLVPYEESRHNGIKQEAARQNAKLRLTGKLQGKTDIKYRVSMTEYEGYTAIACIK